MKKTDLTLPEWAWLDAKDHTGNALEGRDVLLHVRTHTMLEFLNIDDNMPQLAPGVKKMHFTYTNQYDLKENFIVAVHYSMANEFTDLEYVVKNAAIYFIAWMTWMDKSIETEDKTKIN